MNLIIAIDGYSSCGKSTMAKQLARRIGYTYVDTGAMYRAVTLYAMQNGLVHSDGTIDTEGIQHALPHIDIAFTHDTEGNPHTMLNGKDVEHDIRTIAVAGHVSAVAALPQVREALVRMQQKMGLKKRIVMDGRDIGTTVFPNAELKIFVTASPEVRAQRRFDEMKAKGMDPDYQQILDNVIQRDYTDSHRATSPLRQADDAIVLDNSHMTIDQQSQWLMQRYEEKAKP